MTSTVEQPAETLVFDNSDPLFQLQLRVARRADEVVRENAHSLMPDLLAWLQSEREIFSHPGAGATSF